MVKSMNSSNEPVYRIHKVYISNKGVAYPEQDPIDKGRLEIATNLSVERINSREHTKEQPQLFHSNDAVLAWARRILGQTT